jgi:hypothetical protein
MDDNAFAVVRQDILSRLDIQRECQILGIRFTSNTPDSDGWLPCRAWGRPDDHPSAAVNVNSGVYVDHGSGEKPLSFFDLATRTGRFPSWQDAQQSYADQVRVVLPGNGQPKPSRAIEFTEILATVARNKGTTADGLMAYGATPCMRRQGLRFYTYNEKVERELCFFITTKNNDKGLWQSKNSKGDYKKKADKQTGFFAPHPDGTYNKPQLPKPGEHWLIVEGVKDASAAYDILGRKLTIGLNGTHFRKEYTYLFSGVHVTIGLSRDKAGESGATKIASLLYGTAASVKIANWPFGIEEKGGKDLRDTLKLSNGKSLAEQALAAAIDWQLVAESPET